MHDRTTERVITESLHCKIQEAIDRTAHLVSLVPAPESGFHPRAAASPEIRFTDLAHLLGHLLDCTSGICAALRAAFPSKLAHFDKLRCDQVNHGCEPAEALLRIAAYSTHISHGFSICTDSDLARKIPTVFVPQGETLATLLLGNLEHLLNHKAQLFFYLKLLGVHVGTADLYALRADPPKA